MFKKLVTGLKNFFADDPDELGPEELLKLVLDPEAPLPRRKEGAACLSELSDKISEMPASDVIKTQVSDKIFATLCQQLGAPECPEWLILPAIKGMNEIVNISRYEMDKAGLEAAADPLISRLSANNNPEVRSAAAGALSSFDDFIGEAQAQRAIEAVMQNARSGAGEIRADAIFNLGSFSSERTARLWDEVATYLDDPHPQVRAHTASALWMIGNDAPPSAVVERIVELLKSERDDDLQDDFINALGHLGRGVPSVVPALQAALANEDTRHMAIFALMEHEADADIAVVDLARYIDDEDWQDSVVMALQGIGTPSARELLRAKGHDEES